MIRQAISPRLAIKILSNMSRSDAAAAAGAQ
jgi:hypothetical protein